MKTWLCIANAILLWRDAIRPNVAVIQKVYLIKKLPLLDRVAEVLSSTSAKLIATSSWSRLTANLWDTEDGAVLADNNRRLPLLRHRCLG